MEEPQRCGRFRRGFGSKFFKRDFFDVLAKKSKFWNHANPFNRTHPTYKKGVRDTLFIRNTLTLCVLKIQLFVISNKKQNTPKF